MSLIRVSPEFSNDIDLVSPLFRQQRDAALVPLRSARPGSLIGLVLGHRRMRQEGRDCERIVTFECLLQLGPDARSLEYDRSPKDALPLLGAVLADRPFSELDRNFETHETWRSVHFNALSIVMADSLRFRIDDEREASRGGDHPARLDDDGALETSCVRIAASRAGTPELASHRAEEIRRAFSLVTQIDRTFDEVSLRLPSTAMCFSG